MAIEGETARRELLRRAVLIFKSGRLDLNQRPLRPEGVGDESQVVEEQGVTKSDSSVCSTVCISSTNDAKESCTGDAMMTQLIEI